MTTIEAVFNLAIEEERSERSRERREKKKKKKTKENHRRKYQPMALIQCQYPSVNVEKHLAYVASAASSSA
jgi:hypothetical protein